MDHDSPAEVSADEPDCPAENTVAFGKLPNAVVRSIRARPLHPAPAHQAGKLAVADPTGSMAMAETGRSKPYQDNSPVLPLWRCFPALLPPRPFCTDEPQHGLSIRSKKLAIKRSHIQFNGPGMVRFAVFDIDHADAAFADEAAGVAAPNIVMVNPENGHGHLCYVLAHPVPITNAARDGPLRFLAAIQRGMIRRLGADPGYTGLIAKNPLSSRWRVRWAAPFPYSLADLDGFLTREDKRPAPRREIEMGIGRNVGLFDELRHQAYREVLDFKRRGLCLSAFENRLRAIAGAANATFDLSTGGPLPLREVHGIARSVARFCYRRFSTDAFARIQRHRAETRTRQHLTTIGEIKRDAST